MPRAPRCRPLSWHYLLGRMRRFGSGCLRQSGKPDLSLLAAEVSPFELASLLFRSTNFANVLSIENYHCQGLHLPKWETILIPIEVAAVRLADLTMRAIKKTHCMIARIRHVSIGRGARRLRSDDARHH